MSDDKCPDAAVPKGYPRDATGYPTRSPATFNSDAAAPPTDTAQPVGYVYHTLGPGKACSGDPWRFSRSKPSGKVWNLRPVYDHPEDAPEGPTVEQIAKILCPGYNHAQRGLRTPAETKPDLPCRRCLVWAEGVRDALNRLTGDKSDG